MLPSVSITSGPDGELQDSVGDLTEEINRLRDALEESEVKVKQLEVDAGTLKGETDDAKKALAAAKAFLDSENQRMPEDIAAIQTAAHIDSTVDPGLYFALLTHDSTQ